jgi:hypothetical protein
MWRKKASWALGLVAAVLLAAPATLWAQSDYLDEYIVKVKPEKISDFEVIAKKIADANRRNNGDRFLAMQALYGEPNTYVFVSRRQDYADIDKASDAFMNAVNKTLGKEGADKLFRDFNSCLISSRAELRLRRPDLSSKMPVDAAALNKLVGESRVLRTITLRVRAGHVADFETLIKEVNAHADRNTNTQPVLVSQAIEGERGDTFYITFLRSSLGGFDKNVTLAEILGPEGLAKFEKTVAEISQSSESSIYRFVPELSNPPQEIAEVAADFWQPKTMVASAARLKAKAPTGESPSAAANPKEKPRQ